MKALIVMIVLLAGVAALAAGCTGTNKTTDLANSETATIVADAISAALIPAVEITLEKHPEYAADVSEIASLAALEWPQGKSVTLTVIGDRIEELVSSDRLGLSQSRRTTIMAILTSLRTGVRVYLSVRGYELPEVVTTDGAALMRQISAIALASGASGSNG